LVGATIVQSPWSRPLDRGQERAIKRDAVLRAAAGLFNEFGYHATSLDRVAEQLQVTKPTLYYYVQNKEEILFECVRLGLEMLRTAIADAAASGGTALDKLEAAMHEYALIVTREFGMCLIRVGEDPLAPESRKELRRLKAELDHEFRALIEQGIAEGSLAPCDPKLAAFTLAGALSWIGRWYDPHGPLSAEEVAQHSTTLLMEGLLPRPSERRPYRSAASRGGDSRRPE
jgi:AcrR family transcriptional regulator